MKFLLMCAVLVMVTWGVYQLWVVQRSVAVSARLIAAARPFEQHPVSARTRILVAGDSTAVGVGSSPEHSIAGRIEQDNPDADITNIGVSGLRLEGLLTTLAMHRGQRFDMVVLQIGANDITGRTAYADIKAQLAHALHDAVGLAPKVVVMTSGDVGLAPIFKWPVSAYLSARTRAVREIFIAEIQKHPAVTYVDLYVEKEKDIFLTDIPRYYAEDRFHPSGEGYGIWFAQFPK